MTATPPDLIPAITPPRRADDCDCDYRATYDPTHPAPFLRSLDVLHARSQTHPFMPRPPSDRTSTLCNVAAFPPPPAPHTIFGVQDLEPTRTSSDELARLSVFGPRWHQSFLCPRYVYLYLHVFYSTSVLLHVLVPQSRTEGPNSPAQTPSHSPRCVDFLYSRLVYTIIHISRLYFCISVNMLCYTIQYLDSLSVLSCLRM